jgi:hypothetical protein
VKEAWQLNGDIIHAKVMTAMLALFSDIDRDLISLRTKEALQARKKSGVKPGRPRGPEKSHWMRAVTNSWPCSRPTARKARSPENTSSKPDRRELDQKKPDRYQLGTMRGAYTMQKLWFTLALLDRSGRTFKAI